jgi:protein-disulfide isomerase
MNGETATGVRGRPTRSPWYPRIGLGIAAVLLAIAIVSLAVGQGGPKVIKIRGTDAQQPLFGGVEQDGNRLGNPDAPVEISIFNDLQCIPCAHYETKTVDGLVSEYARGDSARLVYHHLSFGGAETTIAAHAAVAAGNQGREWQYVDLFFRSQGIIRSSRVTDQFLTDVANTIPEFDRGEWDDDRGSAAVEAQVQDDAKLADSLRLPIDAPSIVVSGPNGQKTLEHYPTKTQVDAAVQAVS